MEAEDLLTVPSRTKGREATNGVIPGRFALSVGHPALPTPPGWKWTKLSDVARLESGHTPSRKHPEYWGGDVPWIGIKDAVDNHGRTINNTYQHVTELGLANSSARLLPKHTVCLSRTASIGYVTVMGRPMATSQDFVNWVCSDGIEPRFLKAILIAEHESLWRFASGTTHQTIYYPEVKAFHVCLPPIQEQRAIAHILGSLDDKIELNREMNKTLEAMAQAIFKSWFIDFDPVRAKMEGRQPAGMDAATAELFPSEFEESALGMIPKGWLVTKLDKICEIVQGFSFKSKDFSDEGQILVRIGNFTENGTLSFTEKNTKFFNQETKEKFKLIPGNLVICLSDVTQKGLLIGNPGFIPNDGREYILNQRVGKIEVDSLVKNYLYCVFKNPEFKNYAINASNSTTVLNLSSQAIKEYILFLPSREILNIFSSQISSIYQKSEINIRENVILASIRDTLLPKLLSGEIRVK